MRKRNTYETILGWVAVVALGAVLAAPAFGQDGGPPGKLKRQIGVMERVLDGVLVDSPNFLIASRKVTRGLYLEEFGALFTLEASLLDGEEGEWWERLKGWSVERKDNRIIIHQDDDDEDDDEEIDSGERSHGRSRAHMAARQDELYEKGTEELLETLMDYGETLSGLKDRHWVAIAAFLSDDYFLDQKISHLVLKAKMADLRAYGSERISRKEMLSRIVRDEY